jgi:hypothetical protein
MEQTERSNIAKEAYLLANTNGLFNKQDLPALIHQIDDHKYFVNQSIPWVISWDDAAFSWYENVFTPIMNVVTSWEVRNAFGQKNPKELYFEISQHWYYLQEKNPAIDANYAAISYAATFGKGLGRWLSRLTIGRSVA